MLTNEKGFQASKIDSDNFRKGECKTMLAKRYNCEVVINNANEIVKDLIYVVSNPIINLTDMTKLVGVSKKQIMEALTKGASLVGCKGRINGIDIEIIGKTETGLYQAKSNCQMYILLQE